MPEERDDVLLLHPAAKFQINPKLKNLNCCSELPNFHLQWRKNSPDELDVFDANTYFSTDDITNLHLPFSLATTTNPIPPLHVLSTSKISRRQSLDSSKLIRRSTTNSINYVDSSSEKKTRIKSPTSPGQKLSTFLSSLFSHSPNSTHNDKIKTKMKTAIKKQINILKLHSKDATISRSSTSSNSTAAAALSFTATSRSASRSSTNSNSQFQIEKDYTKFKFISAGFRTPPPYYYNTSKSKIQTDQLHDDLYEINDLGHHLQNPNSCRSKSVNFVPSYNYSSGVSSSSSSDSRHVTVAWLQQRFTNGFWRNQSSGATTNDQKVIRKDQAADQDKSVLKERSAGSLMGAEDDGFESDSSSDLFELESFRCSSGLPVYEGTDLGKIMKQRNHSN